MDGSRFIGWLLINRLLWGQLLVGRLWHFVRCRLIHNDWARLVARFVDALTARRTWAILEEVALL